jgi:hypothetical protein
MLVSENNLLISFSWFFKGKAAEGPPDASAGARPLGGWLKETIY